MTLKWHKKTSPAACTASAVIRTILQGLGPDEALEQTLYNGRHTTNPEDITLDEMQLLKDRTSAQLEEIKKTRRAVPVAGGR